MCCCAEFLVKYVIFIANFVFCLAGLALIGVGVAVLLQLSDVLEIIPVPVNVVPITVIVLGSIIFVIAFLGCCGAVRKSTCMLSMYTICMAILAAIKIWLATVIFRNLSDMTNLVTEWLTSAFNQTDREPFHLMEIALRCCGTTGAGSYGAGALPPTCCATESCTAVNSYGGCIPRLIDYFDSFGNAIGVGIIVVIVIEAVACIFGIFLACRASNKRTYA